MRIGTLLAFGLMIVAACVLMIGCNDDSPSPPVAPTVPTVPTVPEPPPTTEVWSGRMTVGSEDSLGSCNGIPNISHGYHAWDQDGAMVPDSFVYAGTRLTVFSVRLDVLQCRVAGGYLYFQLSSTSQLPETAYPLTLHVGGTAPRWQGWRFEFGELSRNETTDGSIKFHVYNWRLDGMQTDELAWTTGDTVDLSLTEPTTAE